MSGWPFYEILSFAGFWVRNSAPGYFTKKRLGEESEDGKLSIHTCCSSSWYVGKDHVGLPFQHIFNVLKVCQCFDVFNFIKEQGTEEAEKTSLATG